MKIKSLPLPFTARPVLLACFFAVIFVFAGLKKEDRYRIREWKKDLMSRLAEKKKSPVTPAGPAEVLPGKLQGQISRNLHAENQGGISGCTEDKGPITSSVPTLS